MTTPLVKQALSSLTLLEAYFNDYLLKNKVEDIPLEVVHLYTGLIVKNARMGRVELSKEGELKAFDFMIDEINSILSVLGGSCIKYCENHKTDEVPVDEIEAYFIELRNNIAP